MGRRVTVGHGEDGFYLHVTDWPWYAVLVENLWLGACAVTRGWAGGHGCPGFMWKIPLGWPKWDHDDPDDPLLINSIAWRLHDLENVVLLWADGKSRPIAEFDISEDIAQKLEPKFASTYLEDQDDESDDLRAV